MDLSNSSEFPVLSGSKPVQIVPRKFGPRKKFSWEKQPEPAERSNVHSILSTLPIHLMQKIFVIGGLRRGDQKAVRCVCKLYSGLLSRKKKKVLYVNSSPLEGQPEKTVVTVDKFPRFKITSVLHEKYQPCITCGKKIRCRGKKTVLVHNEEDQIEERKRPSNKSRGMQAVECVCGCWAHRECTRSVVVRQGHFENYHIVVGTDEHCDSCVYNQILWKSLYHFPGRWSSRYCEWVRKMYMHGRSLEQLFT